jgi:hypothetical protein
MAGAGASSAEDQSVEPGCHRFRLGREQIPERLCVRLKMAVAIAAIQEDLIRRGRMSPNEIRDYAWSVMEDAPDEDGRVLRVIAAPLRSTKGGRKGRPRP